jgi:tetratricopeptide (TPR) repeat protein
MLFLGLIGCSSTEEATGDRPINVQENSRTELLSREQWNSQHNPDKALEHFISGSILEEKEDFNAAVQSYSKALLFDDNASIFAGLTRSYLMLRAPMLAVKYARETVLREPDNVEYRKQLAHLFVGIALYDSAIVQFEEVLKLKPSDKRTKFAVAQLIQRNDPMRALEMYEEIQDYVGEDWDLNSRMAELYNSTGQLDKAAESLEALHRIDPENELVLKTLAGLYGKLKRYDLAANYYEVLIEKSPQTVRHYLGLAEIRLHQNRWDDAARAMRLALQESEITTADALKIGEIHFQYAITNPVRTVEALDLFIVLKRKYPEEWKPSWYMGATLYNQTQFQDAIPHFKEALALDANNAEVMDVLSRALISVSSFDEAQSVLNEIIDLDAANIETYTMLAYAHQQLGQNNLAAEVLEKALELDPNSMEALSSLALLYDDQRKFEHSDRLYQRALKMYEDGKYQKDQSYALLLNNYAYSLAERNERLEDALDMVKQSIESEPENSSFLDTIGWVHFKLGNNTPASEYIEKAIQMRQGAGLAPGPVLLDHLGDIYYKMGQKQKALELWKNAFSSDPTNKTIERKIEMEQR